MDMKYRTAKDQDLHLKEWEKSLPHDEYFFPSVPRFKLTELKQELGLEFDGHDYVAPASSLSSFEEEDDLNYPSEHYHVCERDNALGMSPCEQPPSIKEGETFDLEDCLVSSDDDEGHYLVRKDGTTLVQVDSLRNKHVLLCCFYVPLYWAILAIPYARSLSSLCVELATSKREEECEMVIVAKMAPHWADNKAAFDHFFKAFPDSCLTVPFHHKKRINRICQSLNLKSFYPRSLFISRDKKVLHTYLNHPWKYYGVKDGYPFSNEHLKAVDEDDKRLLSGSSSSSRPLATLLGGWDPLPSEHRLQDVVTGEERISISQLEKKDVGVYLCCKGDLLDRLSEVYHHCKNNLGRYGNFEIVVVWCPDVTGLVKSEFEHLMTAAFKLRGLSFLVLPFDNSVARRLIRISGGVVDDWMSDRLLTVGADGAFVDPIADKIIGLWDIDYAYPFSFAGLLDKEVNRLGSVELDSILGKIKSVVRVEKRNQSEISPEELKAKLIKKRVFLYHTYVVKPMDYTRYERGEEDDPWFWWEDIKVIYPDCEVLYVQSFKMDYDSRDFPKGLSLYMCPFDASLSKYLDTITSVAPSYPVDSVAFGKDGHITALGRGDDPFAKTLREDIRFELVSFIKGHQKNNCHPRLFHGGGLLSCAYLGTTIV